MCGEDGGWWLHKCYQFSDAREIGTSSVCVDLSGLWFIVTFCFILYFRAIIIINYLLLLVICH